jgi:ABC-type transport system involved in multi-copper enzyme maturation permease subunit
MNRPNEFYPVIRIAKYTFTDEARQKSFVIMFMVCALFIFLVRGCYQGHYMVNGQALDAETVIRIISKMTFHMIAVGVMLLTALLSMRVFKRDREDGMQACILSKPIARWQYVAGKISGLWALSVLFMLTLHGIVFMMASIHAQAILPEYLIASILCTFNLLFVILAVLLFSLLMPDIVAFLLVTAIGIIGAVADGIFAISRHPMAQAMIGQSASPSDLTGWKMAYYVWPKLSGAQQFAASFIGSEGFPAFASLYPLVNILIFSLIFGALLFRRFRNEDII